MAMTAAVPALTRELAHRLALEDAQTCINLLRAETGRAEERIAGIQAREHLRLIARAARSAAPRPLQMELALVERGEAMAANPPAEASAAPKPSAELTAARAALTVLRRRHADAVERLMRLAAG
jgi:hypothetical protein